MKKSPVRKGYVYDTLQPGQVLSSFLTRRLHICKAGRYPCGERWNYCRAGCLLIFHKLPLSRHLGKCFWISEPVLVQTKYFVSVCSTYRLSAMYALWSWLVPIDEIHLYANDMKRNYTEYGTKTEFGPTEATGIYSFVFIPYMCWIWVRSIGLYKKSNTFNVILSTYRRYRRYLETLHSIRDEIGIITNDW